MTASAAHYRLTLLEKAAVLEFLAAAHAEEVIDVPLLAERRHAPLSQRE